MLAHLRLTCPADLTDAVVELLCRHDWITDVTLLRGAVLRPVGDVVECEVAREKVGEVVAGLDALGLDRRGGIVVTTPTSAPFDRAAALGLAAPGHPDDAVVWDAVEEQAEAGAVPTLSFHVFLVLAVALAAIAVVTDSAVLVVGAMVVGPEYSAIAATCVGLARLRPRLVWRGARLLVLSFALTVGVVVLLALLARAGGLVGVEEVTRARPNTGFIWKPDAWSFVVALLAGAAGALALAVARAATMVGVFISVTTVPAAGNLALGIAVGDRGEVVGSLAQLGLNVAGLLVAGWSTLLLVRGVWPWLATRTERLFGARVEV